MSAFLFVFTVKKKSILVAQSEKLQKDFEAIEKTIQLYENKVRAKQLTVKKTNFNNDGIKNKKKLGVERTDIR